MKNKTICLNNNISIPAIGLGTCNLGNNDNELIHAMNLALEIGYRLFDTANGYNNEKAIGEFVRSASIRRSNYYITSKLDDNIYNYKQTIDAVNYTLERLNTDYLDVFLIHNPNSQTLRNILLPNSSNVIESVYNRNIEVWAALEECVKQKMINTIGVSNFYTHHLKKLLPFTKIVPAINQIKFCPGCYGTQKELIDYCMNNSIQIQGYSPFGKGFVLNSTPIVGIANKLKCQPSELILSYLEEKSIPIVIKSKSYEHLYSNYHSKTVKLNQSIIKELESIRFNDDWSKIKDPDSGKKYN